MAKKYDLILQEVVLREQMWQNPALKKTQKELKVAVADYLFGGTCALKGCTPKKAMESVTSLWWGTQHFL